MYADFKFLVEGICLTVVGLMGGLGNCLCIGMFIMMEGNTNFHQLMQSLAAFDLMYVVLSILMFGIPNMFNIYGTEAFKRMFTSLLPFAQIGLTGSIYMTLAIAIERYTTVCHPFFKFYHSWSANLYILPIIFFSVAFNIPKFFELRVDHVLINPPNQTADDENWFYQQTTVLPNNSLFDHSYSDYEYLLEMDGGDNYTTRVVNSSLGYTTLVPENTVQNLSSDLTEATIVPTLLRQNPIYIKVYLVYLNLFIHCIIPLFSLVLLNTAVYRQMRKVNDISGQESRSELHRKETRLSQVSLLIVVVFIICHSIRWIPTMYELNSLNSDSKNEWPQWLDYFSAVSHLCMTFNSSVNFYIYKLKHGGCACTRSESRGSVAATTVTIIDPETANNAQILLRKLTFDENGDSI